MHADDTIGGAYTINGAQCELLLESDSISWWRASSERRNRVELDQVIAVKCFSGRRKNNTNNKQQRAKRYLQESLSSPSLQQASDQEEGASCHKIKVYYAKRSENKSTGRLLKLKKLCIVSHDGRPKSQERNAIINPIYQNQSQSRDEAGPGAGRQRKQGRHHQSRVVSVDDYPTIKTRKNKLTLNQQLSHKLEELSSPTRPATGAKLLHQLSAPPSCYASDGSNSRHSASSISSSSISRSSSAAPLPQQVAAVSVAPTAQNLAGLNINDDDRTVSSSSFGTSKAAACCAWPTDTDTDTTTTTNNNHNNNTKRSLMDQLAKRLEQALELKRKTRPKRLLVFVNPFGGKGKALLLYKTRVQRLLEMAKIDCTLIVTKYANHARDTIEDPLFNVEHFDGIVCIGGDGMFSELMNGLLFRYNRDKILTMELSSLNRRLSGELEPMNCEELDDDDDDNDNNYDDDDDDYHDDQGVDDVDNRGCMSRRQQTETSLDELRLSSLASTGNDADSVINNSGTFSFGGTSNDDNALKHAGDFVAGTDGTYRQPLTVDDTIRTKASMTLTPNTTTTTTMLVMNNNNNNDRINRSDGQGDSNNNSNSNDDNSGNNIKDDSKIGDKRATRTTKTTATNTIGAKATPDRRQAKRLAALRQALGGIGQAFVSPPIPIGVIGAGSTDANSFGLIGTNDVITATLNIIVGNQIQVDACSIHSVRDDRLLRFVSTFVAYGYFGDVIRESERLRWLGPSRYDVTGINNLIKNRTYKGRVRILYSQRDGTPHDIDRCHLNCSLCCAMTDTTSSSSNSSAAPISGQYQHEHPLCEQAIDGKTELGADHNHAGKLEFVEKSGSFVGVNAAVTACRCPQTRKGFSPSNHLANGCADLILVRPCTRVQYLNYLLRTGWTKKSPFDLKYVEAYRCRQFEFIADATNNNNNNNNNSNSNNNKSSVASSTSAACSGSSSASSTSSAGSSLCAARNQRQPSGHDAALRAGSASISSVDQHSNSNSLDSKSSDQRLEQRHTLKRARTRQHRLGVAYSSWNVDGEILNEQSIRVKVNNRLLRVFGTGEPQR